MNNQRRALLKEAIKKAEEARIAVEQAADDEQMAYDNLPDPIKFNQRGDDMLETIDYLQCAESDLGTAIDSIREALWR